MRTWLIMPLLLSCMLILAAACGGGGGDDDDDEETPTPDGTAAEETERPATVEELSHSVVQIQALDDNQEAVWWGSGTIISADGLILTNAHVIDDRFDEYEELGVATTTDSDEPPELVYLAEIAAVDYALDLAVIRIVSDLDGADVDEEFSYIELGDSEEVEIGDAIRVLGYPSIGGDTITLSSGAVSGFTAERSVGGRAWIKTDATIAGGNSGGLAMNTASVLIGVPTVVGSGSDEADYVDCRPLADTNRDGVVDDEDDCVPVGGFINGLRPVNLALPLIDAAEEGREYVSEFFPEPEDTPEPISELDDAFFYPITFADGVTDDDEPTDIYEAFPSGVTHVCGFWDYEGMVDGLAWEGLWLVDGELNEDGSILDETWVGGDEGNWWVCIFDEENGLDDGLYELVLNVENEFFASGVTFVGGDHPSVDFSIENDSSEVICYAYISPDGAQNWGADDLGGDVILDGDSFDFELPSSVYDMLLQDCDDNTLYEDYGIDITEDTGFTLAD